MKRRDFIALLGGTVAVWPITAHAQQGAKVRRIGVFVPGSVQTHGQNLTALRNRLNSLGYAEGTDYVLLVRWGEGNFDRFSDYARELIETGPEVILVTGTAVATAVKGQRPFQ
jgi:putative tryptophan/tyrosine transport system substrate-binding protein